MREPASCDTRYCFRCGREGAEERRVGESQGGIGVFLLCPLCQTMTTSADKEAYRKERPVVQFEPLDKGVDLHVPREVFPRFVESLLGPERAALALAPHDDPPSGDRAATWCSQCGEERSLLPRKTICWGCYYRNRGIKPKSGSHKPTKSPPPAPPPKPPKPALCPCGSRVHGKGLCDRCYRKARYHSAHPGARYMAPRRTP